MNKDLQNFFDTEISDTLKDGQGTNNVKKFFHQVIKNFAEESYIFYKVWEEFPFVYRERQVNSVLIPAIHKYTKTIWLEQPFKKKAAGQRFLDIVTTDKDNIYLIELKHSFNSRTENIRKATDEEWKKAIEQIADVNKQTLGSYYHYKDFNVFKIALMIMPMYIPSKELDRLDNLTIKKYHNQIVESFDNTSWTEEAYANLFGTIRIQNPLDFEHKWPYGSEIYPFVSFIARVERL